MGCDFISVAAACRALRFQSTHPSGVRRLRSPVAVCFTYFNPRTPVGCDVLVDPQHGCDHISIHAPQWGATSVPSGQGGGSIFQSTHPSGVRPGTFSTQVLQYDFNPRTPVGCDIPTIEFFAHEIISIHAPQWGATRREWSRQSLHKFQSTHPSGVRPAHPRSRHIQLSNFNPRTPVGCDRHARHIRQRCPHFNPRTPVGCD